MRSGFEEKIREELDSRGVEYGYETDSFQYFLKKTGHCPNCGQSPVYITRWYTPDFFLPNGIIVEAKGKFTPSHRTMLLAVREAWPELDLRLLFQRDNWLTKKKKSKYSDWCEQKGFRYAIAPTTARQNKGDRIIPEEWLQ